MDSSSDAPQHGDASCDHVTGPPEKRKRGRPQKSTDNMDSSTDAPQHGDAAYDHVTRPPEKRKRGRPKKTLACTKSGYSSHLRDSFKRHERPFKRDRCDCAAIQKANLVRHMENHTSKSPLKCKHCGYRANTQSALSRHMAVHLEKKATNSDNVLASGSQKEEDITVHSTCRLFCNKNEPVPSTQYQTALTSHLTVHSKKEAEKSCSATDTASTVAECVEPNASKQALFRGKSEPETVQDKHGKKRKKQLKTRTEKKVDCSIVANVKPEASQDGTNDKKSLRLQCDGVARPGQNHMYKQTTCHKRFACKGCGFTTPVKGTLKRHMFTHSSQKPYKCRQCDYTAIRKVQLLLHMKGHTRNSLLKCGKCGFGTNFKFVLSRHMAIHTKKEPGNSTTSTSQKDETVTGHAQDQIMGDQSEPETNSKPQTPSRKMQTKKKVSKPSGVTNVKPEVSEKGTERHQLLRDCVSTTQKIKPATPNKPFMCKVCGYATAIKGDLKRHMFRHSSQKPYKCDRCDYSATQKHQLLQHLKGHTCNGLLKCKYCGFSSDHQGVITKHEEVHLRKESDKSGNSTTSRSQEEETVTAHAQDQLLSDQSESETSNKAGTPSSQTHTKKKAYKPNNVTNVKPEVSFDSTDNKERNHLLRNRVSMTQNNKPLVCKACGFWTARKHDLKRHMLLHSSDNPFKCDRCGYAAVQKHQLHVHMKGHTRNSPLKCLECGYGTNCQKFLTRHKAVHTKKEADKSGNATTSTSQEEPDTGYAQDQLLSDQSETETYNKAQTPSKNTHTEKKVYKPNNVTAVKIDLSRDSTDNKEHNKLLHGHVSTTQNNKQLVCKECGFSTARKSQFRVHVRIHSGEKPYKCDLCGYSAAQRNGLTCHMKGHTHKRPLKCSECGFSTSRQKFLTSHMAVHVKKQPDKSDNSTTSTSEEVVHDIILADNQTTQNIKSEYKTGKKDVSPKGGRKSSNVTTGKPKQIQHTVPNSETQPLLNIKYQYELRDKVAVVKDEIHTGEQPCKRRRRTSNAEKEKRQCVEPSASKTFLCRQCQEIHTAEKPCKPHVGRPSAEEEEKPASRKIKISASNLSKPFQCGQCAYLTNNVWKFDHHLAQHSCTDLSKNRYLCGQCAFATSKKSHWDRHTLQHCETKPFACDKCNFRTNYRFYLSAHAQRMHLSQKTKAYKQVTKFSRPESDPKSYEHMYTVGCGARAKRMYSCKKCEYAAAMKVLILRHVKTHTKDKQQNGNNNNSSYSQPENEKQVSESKSSTRSMTLTEVTKFSRPKSEPKSSPKSKPKSYEHMYTLGSTNLASNLYSCKKCEYASALKAPMLRHVKTHTEGKPQDWNDNNSSKSRHDDEKHFSNSKASTRSMTEVTKFSRPTSEPKSKPKSHEHMYTVGSTNLASKLYSCKKCEYASALKAPMLRHVKTHTEEKPQDWNDGNSSTW